MIRRAGKKKRKLSFYIVLGIILVVILGIFSIYYFGKGGIKENIKLKNEIEELDNEIRDLEAKNDQLEKELLRMKKDPQYLMEKVAREDLRMKEKNEKVVYFKEKSSDAEDN